MKLFRHSILNERTLGGGFKAIPEDPLNPSELLQVIKDSECEDLSCLIKNISPLFFCFRHPSSWDITCLHIMIKAIRENILKYRIEFVSTLPVIDSFIENQCPQRGRTVESGDHKGMKLWLREHLTKQNIPVARDEVSMLGYKVDVGSLAQSIFVECGDTEPKKVFDFLRHGYNIGIFQYNSEDIVWFLSSKAFISYASSEWQKIL